jgi:phosphoribulokinase
VDALHVHGDAAREDSEVVEKAIFSRLGTDSGPPACLGRIRAGRPGAMGITGDRGCGAGRGWEILASDEVF